MWVYTGYSRQPYNGYNTWIDTLIPKYHWPFTCWIQCIWKDMFNILLRDAWHLLRRNSWNVILPVEFLSLNGQVISKLSASNEFRTAWAADVTDNCGLLWKRGIRYKIGTIETVLGYWKISLLKYYAMRQKTKSAEWVILENKFSWYMYDHIQLLNIPTWRDTNVICKKYTAMYVHLD